MRSDVPIYVEPHVLEQAGTPLEDEESTAAPEPTATSEEPEPSEEGLSIFRDFINSLDLDQDEGRKDK